MSSDAIREARDLARGIGRLLASMGYRTLTEFTFANGRRADVIGLNAGGDLTIVEIKRTTADLRGDDKWPEYLPYCDTFYFGVPDHFPRDTLPESTGIIVADRFGAVVEREPPFEKAHASRRRSVILNFGLAAADRLQRLGDPEWSDGRG